MPQTPNVDLKQAASSLRPPKTCVVTTISVVNLLDLTPSGKGMLQYLVKTLQEALSSDMKSTHNSGGYRL